MNRRGCRRGEDVQIRFPIPIILTDRVQMAGLGAAHRHGDVVERAARTETPVAMLATTLGPRLKNGRVIESVSSGTGDPSSQSSALE